MWFVVGFVLFFFRRAKRFMKCFSGVLAVFMGKMIEKLNLPAMLHRHPATATLAGAAYTARRTLPEESSGTMPWPMSH